MITNHEHAMLDLIGDKRDGGAHSADDIAWLIDHVVADNVPDYQLAAWLMAVVCRGMTDAETAALTTAMARSGDVLDLSGLPGTVADKHSTGGVGDKTSLVVGPLAAASGLTVAKMSGRGLGHTGGTLDKLESIPGLTIDLDIDRFRAQAREVGLVIAGPTADLAPADKQLYALRDVTGTVPSLPLIAASIMSKKIAAGASTIVLDVKVGRGAFVTDKESGRALARSMIDLGRHAGLSVAAQLSDMHQPLGLAVGNALEVTEAALTLRGGGPPDLLELALRLTALMHAVSGTVTSANECVPVLEQAIRSGSAFAKLQDMVAAQGGDPRALTDPRLMPTAPVTRAVVAPRTGFVTSVDAAVVGVAAVDLGAGRKAKGEPVDHAVGVVLRAKTGTSVQAGDPLAIVHARNDSDAADAVRHLCPAFQIGDGVSEPPKLLLETLT